MSRSALAHDSYKKIIFYKNIHKKSNLIQNKKMSKHNKIYKLTERAFRRSSLLSPNLRFVSANISNCSANSSRSLRETLLMLLWLLTEDAARLLGDSRNWNEEKYFNDDVNIYGIKVYSGRSNIVSVLEVTTDNLKTTDRHAKKSRLTRLSTLNIRYYCQETRIKWSHLSWVIYLINRGRTMKKVNMTSQQ